MRTGVSALGLRPGASRADIARAYRRLALLTHPDVSPDPTAAQRFAALTEAYERALAETESNRTVPSPPPRPPGRSDRLRQFVAGPVHVVPEPFQPRREG
jgi:hypothetical protein